MGLLKGRVMVNLDPAERELLNQVAKIQGVSASALLRELFQLTMPMFQQVVDIHDSLQKATDEVREAQVERVQRAVDTMQPLQDMFVGQAALAFDVWETLGADLRGEGGEGRALLAAARGEDSAQPSGPPTCNTGVRSPKETNKADSGERS